MTEGVGVAVRRIQLGSALSAFGIGFTVPFLYVYVAQVRGLGSGAAGLVLAVFAMAALVVLPFTGRVIDRRGPLFVLVVAALIAASGAVGLGVSGGTAAAVLSAAVLGAGTAVMQPALATMIVWCSDPVTRMRAFATQFFLQNLGLGGGGLLGGCLVDVDRPGSFTLLFAIEAAMFLVLAAIAASVRIPRVPQTRAADTTGALPGGALPSGETMDRGRGLVRALREHQAVVRLLVLSFVLFFACYGQFESGLSAYAVEAAGMAPSMLGVALAANTATIVVTQFAMLKRVSRHRRSRVIASVGVLWALAWAMAGFAGLGPGGETLVTAAFITTYVLFGLGETMLSPVLVPLVADLAPSGKTGRYNSAFALVKQLALAIGPAVGGPMGAALHGPYVVTFLLVSLVITVLAVRLGRWLAPAQDQPSLARSRMVAAGGPPAERIPEARTGG